MTAVVVPDASLQSALVCSGCGCRVGPEIAEPFVCPRRQAGDDIDHVLVRTLSGPEPAWPGLADAAAGEPLQPFIQFRRLLHGWRVATAAGLDDESWRALVQRLDDAVARVDGGGFRCTPYGRADELSAALGFSAQGGVFIKDETGNVAGSHKARHLMGLALWLSLSAELGLEGAHPDAPLAIASCGNAALAAAVVARAAGRRLQVFVPTDADDDVLTRLRALDAEVLACERRADDPPGDPCLHRFHQALGAGALPFSCQGSENGLVVEGGCTLAWELLSQHLAAGHGALDRVYVQVGGGALASAVGQGIEDALRGGALPRAPALIAVQSEGAAPLPRAWRRLVEDSESGGRPMAAALGPAARKRSRYMWPWESRPVSAATGILDDETYDWVSVLAAVARSGGEAIAVSEAHIARAHELSRRHTEIDASVTGTAGLAGLLAQLEGGAVGPDEQLAVLFTGRGP